MFSISKMEQWMMPVKRNRYLTALDSRQIPSKEKVHDISVERVTQSMLTDRFEVAIADKFHLERIIEGSQEALSLPLPSPLILPLERNEHEARRTFLFVVDLSSAALVEFQIQPRTEDGTRPSRAENGSWSATFTGRKKGNGYLATEEEEGTGWYSASYMGRDAGHKSG